MLSMGTWVIFGVCLLANHMLNVTETFTDILKNYFSSNKVYVLKNFTKFASSLVLIINSGPIITTHKSQQC